MTLCPIFAIGSGKREQAALTPCGKWFKRSRNQRTKLWGKWMEVKQRPEAAWYAPHLGKARITLDHDEQTAS